MPTLQVLNRQADPGAQMLATSLENRQQRILQKQAIEAQKMRLQMEAKQTENAVEKAKLERNIQMLDMGMKLKDRGISAELVPQVLKQTFGERGAMEFFQTIGQAINQMNPSLEQEKMQADIASTKALTGSRSSQEALNKAVTQRLEAMGGIPGMSMGDEGAQIAPQAGDVPSTGTPPQTDALPSQGGMVVPGGSISAGGMSLQFKDPRVEAMLAENRGRAEARVPKATADQRNALTETRQQEANIANMRELAESIGRSGPVEGRYKALAGTVTGGRTNAATKQYLDLLPGMAVGFYRAVTGDKRTSDLDAATRAMPFLWNPTTDDESIRKSKFDSLQKMLDARRQMLQEGSYVIDEAGQLTTPINMLQNRVKTPQQTQDSTDQSGPQTITTPSGFEVRF